jgi:hypothetical protein
MQKRILCYAVALLFSSFLPSQEVTAVYSADKPIWDLRNFSGATDMSAQDDGTSQVFDLGFDFTFFGEPFNQAYMASNGCLILGQLATGNNWEKNCTQYEPSEAPNTNYTMYPFWTDLIMGGNSSMLAMQVDNKVIFGWYEMWEYYRDSKNTFELWLYPNNSYEARYSELDIKDHDVFIGIQGNENERETYYFHDKCFTGQVNSKITSYDDVDAMMDVWDVEQEQYRQEEALLEEFLFQESFLVEDYSEPETFIDFETIEQLDEWFEEETTMEEELANLEAPEEEFIEEIFEEDVVEEIFEDIEERMAEAEFEEQLERKEAPEEFEENFVEEFQVAEREEATGKSSITRELALSVISSAVTTAQNSISGTTAGSFADVTNSTASDTSANSSSNSGISISNSPSMSDQFASSTAQTNQVLDMSNTSVSDSSFTSDSIETESVLVEVVVADVNTDTTQDQIDTSIASANSNSESESIVENIIAQNLQEAQDQAIAQQEETGKYGSENAIIAVMGFVPDFNSYRLVNLPEKEFWYEPKSIYTNNILSDNTEAFYGLAGQSIRTLTDLKNLQPSL